ncbi:MAG: cell envelope integrity protein TolA [Psychromonas sp.]
MKNSTTFIAFVTALSLHLILGAVMLLGMNFSWLEDKPKEQVVIINASIVNQKLFDDLAQKKQDILAEIKRKEDQVRKEKERIQREKQASEKRRKEAEIKRIQAEKDAIVRKKKEQEKLALEKIAIAKALKVKKEAEKAKKMAEAERKKQQAEMKRIETEKVAVAKALEAKQAKEQAEIKRQQKAAETERLRQAELDKQMQAEFESEFSDAQNSKHMSEIARYKALIQNKISRNWQVELSMKGKSCTLAIRLAPDGLVLSAKRSQGDQQLCDSAKRATLRAKTLPIPQDPDIAAQFRDFDITLEPDL